MLERLARTALAAVVVSCGAALPVSAQAAVEAVGFDEAVGRALEHNHDVALAASAIVNAEALLGKARAVILPTVELWANEAWIDDARGFEDITTQPRRQFAAGGTVVVPVLAASEWARKAQAADQVTVARLGAAEVRRQVAVATAQAYLAVIAARRQVEVDERARDNARAQYEYANTRFEGGAGSRLDALRAADVLSTNEVLVERSRLALELSQEGLGVLMASDGRVDAAEEPVFEVPAENEDADLSARADLRLLAGERDAADRVLRDSWKDWLPDVVASFDPLYVDPAGAFQEANTWRAVLGARFPIYLGGERAADRRMREAALDAAETELDRGELLARAEVRSARAAIEAADRGLVHARAAADDANEVLRITEKAFRAGARTNIELVDAQRRARDAETAVARAEDILRRAKLDLQVALGLFGSYPG
jgi:outer membrane protein TolC